MKLYMKSKRQKKFKKNLKLRK